MVSYNMSSFLFEVDTCCRTSTTYIPYVLMLYIICITHIPKMHSMYYYAFCTFNVIWCTYIICYAWCCLMYVIVKILQVLLIREMTDPYVCIYYLSKIFSSLNFRILNPIIKKYVSPIPLLHHFLLFIYIYFVYYILYHQFITLRTSTLRPHPF